MKIRQSLSSGQLLLDEEQFSYKHQEKCGDKTAALVAGRFAQCATSEFEVTRNYSGWMHGASARVLASHLRRLDGPTDALRKSVTRRRGTALYGQKRGEEGGA